MNVSVIIPAYNAGKLLGEALESVINQTHKLYEIIIVDDGSTDNTAEVAKRFTNVKYIFQKNQGTASAVNAGVAMAKGDLLAFLDADDLWFHNKIETQLAVMRENSEVDMIFTLIENFISAEEHESLKSKIDLDTRPRVGIHKSTLMIRRNSFFKIGLLSVANNIDLLDWYARAQEIGIKEFIVREVLVKRRIHGNNQTLVKKEILQEFPGIIKAILERRRSNK